MEYNNDYEVKIAQIGALQGSTAGVHNIYTADLEILKKLEEGGGGGAQIDDTSTGSTSSVWSSYKTTTEIAQGVTGKYEIKTGVSISDNSIDVQDYGQHTKLHGNYIELTDGSGSNIGIISNGRLNYTPQGGTQMETTFDKIITAAEGFTGKQDLLVSGTNIKSVNGQTLLGSGDLTISGGAQIDDTATGSTSVVWSAGKVYTELTEDELTIAQALYLHQQNKQNTLVSGTNIKTVQGNSLLGSGNIDLSSTFAAKSYVDDKVSDVRDENDEAGAIIAQALWVLAQGNTAALNLANQILS